MSDFVSTGFLKALNNYSAKVHQWVAPLDEQKFWSNPFEYGNSFGHPVLHLTGNLYYYLGSQFLNTGYVRNRNLEFTDANPPTKVRVLELFDEAVDIAMRAVNSQNDGSMDHELSGHWNA